MPDIWRKLKNFLSVNPDWTTSILPPNSFRVPSPGSIFGYTGFERKSDSYTSGYAYFKRDTRRSYPETVSVTERSVFGLLPVPNLILEKKSKEHAPIVPGKKRIYKKSEEQPPSSGYFPIINCD